MCVRNYDLLCEKTHFACQTQHTMSDWPPKFTLDSASVLTLLTGDRFYSSADAAFERLY